WALSRDRSSRVALGHEIHLESVVAGVFLERSIGRGLVELRLENWSTVVPSLGVLGEAELRFEAERRESALYERDGSLVLVGRNGNHVYAAVAAPNGDAVNAILAQLREQ